MFEVNEKAKRCDTEQQNLRALQMRTRDGALLLKTAIITCC